MSEPESPEVEVVDAPPDTTDETTALVLRPGDEPVFDQAAIKTLERAGYIVPVGSPKDLREANALKQRLYAAILDERDYMYTVSYQTTSQGKEYTKQYITMNRAEALATAEKLNGTVGAKPKKSGIVKLARALGIVCKPVLREERTIRGVLGFYVVYEATHAKTGYSEEGIGWCDASERRGNMSIHDMIATADTRAYGRAVLRLAGFGDVSADEVISGVSTGEPLPDFVPEPVESKPLEALPPPNDDKVLTATRIWAEAVAGREGDRWAAEAQQDTLEARTLRARARRGDERSAQKLGVLGLQWKGAAQDTKGQQVFDVDSPALGPEDIKLAEAASTPSKTNGGSSDKAWDLSSEKREEAQPPPPETEHPPGDDPASGSSSFDIPQPHPNAETITTGQAKKVSALLLEVNADDRAKAKQWLKDHAHVDGSRHIRANQYEAVTHVLNTIIKKKKES